MTTTREAALEAALQEIMSSDSYESRETFDGSNKHVVITKFGELGQIAHEALATPATEPQGYVEITEEMIVAGRKAADDQYYKWRGFGPREEGQGLDGMHFIVSEALRAALAARPASPDTRVVTDAERDVIAERQRQRNVEGWTPEHDDEHDTGALAMAASCYATVAAWSDHSRMNEGIMGTPPFWPFEWQWWKPTDRRRDAVKACALLIAEIDRLDRAIIGGQDRG